MPLHNPSVESQLAMYSLNKDRSANRNNRQNMYGGRVASPTALRSSRTSKVKAPSKTLPIASSSLPSPSALVNSKQQKTNGRRIATSTVAAPPIPGLFPRHPPTVTPNTSSISDSNIRNYIRHLEDENRHLLREREDMLQKMAETDRQLRDTYDKVSNEIQRNPQMMPQEKNSLLMVVRDAFVGTLTAIATFALVGTIANAFAGPTDTGGDETGTGNAGDAGAEDPGGAENVETAGAEDPMGAVGDEGGAEFEGGGRSRKARSTRGKQRGT